MKKFIVNKVELIEQEDGFKYYGIFDKDNKDWYEELKKFKPDTLKVMYNKESLSVLSVNKDATMIAPTMTGDVVEEIEYKDIAVIPDLYFVNGQIVKLNDCEIIKDGKIVFNKELKMSKILKELMDLKIEYSEKAFEFKKNLWQKNRELDSNNLGKIVTMMIAGKQTHFPDWKFKDSNDNDVYADLTLDEMIQMGVIMQKQVTKAMKTESFLIEKLETLTDEEIKEFDSRKEYEILWNKAD